MRRLAAILDITVPEETWPLIIRETGFEAMRGRAQATAPDPADILKSRARFFRRGSSGAGGEVLSAEEMDRYLLRVQSMASPDVIAWLHHGPER
jgi:aryl sulfotransferase